MRLVASNINIDPSVEAKLFLKHGVTDRQAIEALVWADQRDLWAWNNHDGHGLRLTAKSQTRHNVRMFLAVCPDNDDYNPRHAHINDWQEWDRVWKLMTAIPLSRGNT